MTLRALGAKGDGVTDDRAAIQEALGEHPGQPIDGEGLTYAVDGSIDVRVSVDLRNATIKQIQQPLDTSKFIRSAGGKSAPQITPPDSLRNTVNGLPLLRFDGVATYPEDPVLTGEDLAAMRRMLNIRTLFIHGEPGSPVSVTLEKITVLRGDHPETGMHSNSAGIYLVHVAPLALTDVDISGDGKGAGLFVNGCRDVLMNRVNIHDITWMPYKGDVDFSAEVLAKDFGWNNSPIYDFDENKKQFIRVRVQEQLTGLALGSSNHIVMVNCRVERMGTKIDGKFVPWQADGITVGSVKDLTMRDCVISEAWEGIDFTGGGVEDFVQENIQISDTFAYGFKYAHPQKNGKVIHCVSERAGYIGFTIGSESENIEFLNCVARETGSNGYWSGGPAISGFAVAGRPGENARRITLKDCISVNQEFPGAMDYAFLCDSTAADPALGNALINPTASGAKIEDIHNFRRD